MKKKFTYRDGVSTNLSIKKAEKHSDKIIICLPALGVRASYYDTLTESLQKNGYTNICKDWRGNGESSIRPSRSHNYGYETLIQDIKEIIDWVNIEFENPKIYTIGHSLGGQLSCLLSSRYPNLLDGIIPITSCTIHYINWNRKTQLQLKMLWNIAPILNRLMGYYNGKFWGFGGKEFSLLMNDWFSSAKTGSYKLHETDFDYDQSLSQHSTNVYSITLEGDDLAIETAARDLINRFHSTANIKYQHILKSELNIPKPVHFKWVKEPDYITDLILAWIKSV